MFKLGKLLFGLAVAGATAATVYNYLDQKNSEPDEDFDDDFFNANAWVFRVILFGLKAVSVYFCRKSPAEVLISKGGILFKISSPSGSISLRKPFFQILLP